MRARLALVAVPLLALAACTGSSASTDAAPSADAEPTGTVTVFAAASLTDVFTELGQQLEDQHPGLDVQFNFAGSSALAAQIEQGAPADIFASADEAPMTRVTEAGLAGDPELFASNRLVLAFPLDNPGDIRQPDTAGIPSLAQYLDHDLVLAVCAPEVPCGVAAAEVLERVGLSDAPDTFEDDVRGVLTKVELGEVDAGLVYWTDFQTARDTLGAYTFREAEAARNRYPVAVLDDAPNPRAAQAFVDLLLSDEGQQVLSDAAFFEP